MCGLDPLQFATYEGSTVRSRLPIHTTYDVSNLNGRDFQHGGPLFTIPEVNEFCVDSYARKRHVTAIARRPWRMKMFRDRILHLAEDRGHRCF